MTYTIEKLNHALLLIQIKGRIVGEFQCIQIQEEITELVEENLHNIIFDLSELEYMNSTGLSFLLKNLTLVRKQDGEIVLCNLNKLLESLIVIAKLNSFFVIKESREEAIQYFAEEIIKNP